MYNDVDILTALEFKDRGAFDCLFNLYAQPIYELVCRLTTDDAKADSILEATFVTAWKNMEAYNAKKCSLYSWMLRIAIKESSKTLTLPHTALHSLFNPIPAAIPTQ